MLGVFAFMMKHCSLLIRHCTLPLLCATLLLLTACGTDGGHFKIEGRLLHINGGEFYVYSPDGDLNAIDTIKVQAGRFSYEMPCTRPQTLMIVFPNYTEQPVFAQPGKSVDIEGEASHLKEMKVTGTKDNELMNGFRKQVASCSPQEAKSKAEAFIKEHPASMVSNYLVWRYFIQTQQPDLMGASRLLKLIAEAQPQNGYIKRQLQQLQAMGTSLTVGSPVPAVNAVATDGTRINKAWLTEKPVTVVCVWATSNYTSQSMLRQATEKAIMQEGNMRVLSICLDPSPKDAVTTLKQQGITQCTTVCDGQMLQSPLFRALGLYDLPDNLIIRNGRIAAMHVTSDQFIKALEK